MSKRKLKVAMKQLPIRLFYMRILTGDECFALWETTKDCEVPLHLIEQVRESISLPLFSTAIWKGVVTVENDEIVHIEGDWKDITNKFDEFVDDMLTSEEERPDV